MNNEELTLDYHEHASQMHEGMDFNSDVWQGIPDVPTEEEELQRQKLAETEALKAKDQGLIANNPIQAVQEVGSAIVGGAADAVESVGGFAELTGDTFKTGINTLFGEKTLDSQNPFSADYVSGDANWLDIPDHLVPENHSGLGKLARGLVEFGLLTAATGGVGGYTAGAAKTGVRIAAGARAAGIGAKGVRSIKFIHKGAVIASEGAIADLISNSSESANIANLVNEHAPWVPFSEALAIDPEKDNAWIARIKTMASGAGINLVGHVIAAYIKGAWAAAKARRAGKTVDEANTLGNKSMEDSMADDLARDENASTDMAVQDWSEGRGISHANPREEYAREFLDEEEVARYLDPNTSKADFDELDRLVDDLGEASGNPWDPETGMSARQFEESLTRKPSPFVNPRKFTDTERATYRPDTDTPVQTVLAQGVADMKGGGPGRSYSSLVNEAQLKRLSMNDNNLRQYIVEVAENLATSLFKNSENIDGITSSLNHKDVQALILKQTSDMHGLLEDGGEQAAKNLRAYFKGNKENKIIWTHAGEEVVTGTAEQKVALELLINTLTRKAQGIATGAMDLPRGIPRERQIRQIFDQMEVAMVEYKKIGYMSGLELSKQKNPVISSVQRATINKGLSEIKLRQRQLKENLLDLALNGKEQTASDLMDIARLSGGSVTTYDQMMTYLEAQIRGGRINGKNIPPRLKTELRSVFYNSILSSLKTPVKAIFGTNLISILRPFQAWVGAAMGGNKVEMLMASTQIDAMGQAMAEGLMMFKHNWDLGVNRQAQTYVGRFDFEKDIQDWKSLNQYMKTYASDTDQQAYEFLDKLVDLNNNPWMRYSQNAMGAGDALARTIIGRMEMRMRAARTAYESGVDFDDIGAWAAKNEEAFRKDIFKQDQHGKWVVSDKAAKLAGDEAAMTKALEGNIAGLEQIAKMTGMRAFFPFVRTGFNALNLSFQHTELARFSAKWHDIMKGENLAKYGIRDVDLDQAQALMRGRRAMGNTIIMLGGMAAMSGMMTGDYPMDKETRDLWRLNGIQPNSFKFGDTYVSYRDIEPFNTILAATANVFNHQHVLGEDLRDETIEKLIWMTTAVIVDKSMLAGVEDLAQVMSAETSGGKLSRTVAKFGRAHLPYAGLLAQIGTIMNANEVEANNMWETIWRRDAIAKSGLHPKYDIYSKDRSGTVPYIPAPTNGWLRAFNALSPVAIVPADGDWVKENLAAMSFNLPETLSTYKGVKLDSYERSQMQRYLQMSPLREQLEDLMAPGGRWERDFKAYKALGLRQAEGYRLFEQRFYQQVHKLHVQNKKWAMIRLREDNPILAERIKEREFKKRISKSSSYDDIPYLLNEFPK